MPVLWLRRTTKNKTKKPKLPTLWQLMSQAASEIGIFRRTLLGIVAVYIILYFVVTQGFALSVSSAQLRDQIAAKIGADAGLLEHGTLLMTGVLTNNQLMAQDTATAVLQIILTMLVFLAITWSLRRLHDLKTVRIRDAYFEGTGAFVAFSVVILLLTLMTIPLSLASTILDNAATVAAGQPELLIVTIISILLASLTIYWLLCTWPALYIISLPGMTPLKTIRKARLLTKGRRLQVLFRFFGFILLAAVVYLSVLFVTAVLLPVAVIVVLVGLSAVFFLYATVFMYMAYRSLL